MPHPEKTTEQQAYSAATTMLHLIEAATYALKVSPEMNDRQRQAVLDAATRLWCAAAQIGARDAFTTRVGA